jgi:hypothetical protein
MRHRSPWWIQNELRFAASASPPPDRTRLMQVMSATPVAGSATANPGRGSSASNGAASAARVAVRS